MQFKAHPNLVSPSTNTTIRAAAAPYLTAGGQRSTHKLPAAPPTRRYVLQSTQPLLEENGILRWALNNVAHAETPPCKAVLDTVSRVGVCNGVGWVEWSI